MHIGDDLTNEERKTQKKLRQVAGKERDRGKRVKMGYRGIQINDTDKRGLVYMG
jgi:hypothetical protein